jgi:hypothetical protein
MQLSSPRLRLSAGLVLGCLALGGCASSSTDDASSGSSDVSTGGGSSGPSPSSGTSPSDAASPSASSGTQSSSSSASSGASSNAPAVPRCTTADVRITLQAGDGAAGSVYSVLRMRNTSAAPCRTSGFGGVSYVVRPGGAQVGAAADRVQRGRVKPLTVQPGAGVQATLREVSPDNYPRGECHLTRVAGLRVYPPDETHAVFVAHPTQACSADTVHLLELAPYAAEG